MDLPETRLTERAKSALINANTSSGSLPQGTPDNVIIELRAECLISRTSMTISGRMTRSRLINAALDAL